MILYFEQRISALTSQFGIFNDSDEFFAEVQGKLALAPKFLVLDEEGRQIGAAEEKLMSVSSQFSLIQGTETVASIKKKGLLKSGYEISNGWTIEGSTKQWDWTILKQDGSEAARLEKKLIGSHIRYTITIADDVDPLTVILTVIAVDAERCNHGTIRKTIRMVKQD